MIVPLQLHGILCCHTRSCIPRIDIHRSIQHWPDSIRNNSSCTLTSCNCNLFCALPLTACSYYLVEEHWTVAVQSWEEMHVDCGTRFASLSQELYLHTLLCLSSLGKNKGRCNGFPPRNNRSRVSSIRSSRICILCSHLHLCWLMFPPFSYHRDF